ncbi:MAG: conjugative transposon protein TraJ, partial [Duncaniella dubosii]
WLPVADLFSTILAKIQVLMLQNDISELTNNPNVNLDSSNTCYTIFMIIGIIVYFTIPTVASWIIQSGGMGAYTKHVNSMGMQGGSAIGGIAGSATGNVAGRAGKLLKK